MLAYQLVGRVAGILLASGSGTNSLEMEDAPWYQRAQMLLTLTRLLLSIARSVLLATRCLVLALEAMPGHLYAHQIQKLVASPSIQLPTESILLLYMGPMELWANLDWKRVRSDSLGVILIYVIKIIIRL